ncbi:MAG: cytochrome C [Desulfuromonas sp.]|nr:cytochrome C [Desulfuromonas sp.]
MKRSVIFLLLLMCVACWSTTALAVPKGKSLTFDKAKMGVVTFDGTLHNSVAKKGCRECHNAGTFPQMKQGTVTITMENIYAGRQCGICHNGQRAFAAKGNCKKCHKH